MPTELTCERCGDSYSVPPSRSDSRFCCSECRYADLSDPQTKHPAYKGKVTLECEQCEGEFEVNPNREDDRVYCSKGCHTAAMKERIILECDYCGGKYKKRRSNADRSSFCSLSCKYEGQKGCKYPSRRNRTEGVCDYCCCHFERPASASFRFCSRECRDEAFIGEDHPSWRGGAIPYYGPNWPRMRQVVRNRDCFRCQQCGTHEDECDTELHVHHIVPLREFDEPEEANTPSNLVTVCPSCHGVVEGDVDAGRALL